MQAEVVRAANEWQDKVVQRRVVDRQPETVRAFKQGDWVVHRHFGNRRPTKLSPLWIGPYQVLDQASNSMYRLQDPADLKEHLCHIDELYEYRMGLTDDVVDVIALDQFEAIVHSIVDHRAVGKSKSQWVFRVRFVDCDPSEDVRLLKETSGPFVLHDASTQGPRNPITATAQHTETQSRVTVL
jgi:hypothetical protein